MTENTKLLFLTSFLVTALNFTQHCWALVTFTESIFFTIIEFVIHYFFFYNFTTASCEKLNKIQTTAVLNLQIMCLAHFITLHLHTVRAADYIHILYVHCNIYIFLKKSGSSTSFFPPSISYLATKLMQHFQGLFFLHLILFFPPWVQSVSEEFSHFSTCPPPLRRRGRAARQPPTRFLSGRCMTHNTKT